jgi:hypothetical protein
MTIVVHSKGMLLVLQSNSGYTSVITYASLLLEERSISLNQQTQDLDYSITLLALG